MIKITGTKCPWWKSHTWGKWIITKRGSVNGWPALIQERTCMQCGKVQTSTQLSIK